ncbi:hypothetical protein ABW21_db0203686 [Orbilia brochopaga]|nr:hypothetical protein ABW21_db0203686 [Drechslerella brochopaga]
MIMKHKSLLVTGFLALSTIGFAQPDYLHQVPIAPDQRVTPPSPRVTTSTVTSDATTVKILGHFLPNHNLIETSHCDFVRGAKEI